MESIDIIVREVDGLPPEKQAEVLDFIEFLKVRQSRAEGGLIPKITEEIEVFFRSFNLDTSGYKLYREKANAC